MAGGEKRKQPECCQLGGVALGVLKTKTKPIFFITSAEKGCRGQAVGAGEEEEGHSQSVGRGSPSAQPWL